MDTTGHTGRVARIISFIASLDVILILDIIFILQNCLSLSIKILYGMSFISRFGISGAMRGEQNQWLHPTEPEIASVPEQSTFFSY